MNKNIPARVATGRHLVGIRELSLQLTFHRQPPSGPQGFLLSPSSFSNTGLVL